MKKLNSRNYNKILNFLKILADKERFQIFLFLLKNRYCVCELTEKINLPQNLVSYHLKALKDFNLIYRFKKGRKNFYLVNKKELNKYLKLIKKLLS